MSELYKLPVSSYEELKKIIKAYGNGKVGAAVSLDDLVRSSGMGKTVLSKNNGFLIQLGLITKGNKKAPTEKCQKLAHAYLMNLGDEIESLWRGMIEQDEFFTNMISVVNIKGRISRVEFINHILYSAGCANVATYRAGAATIIELLKIINAVSEQDGYIVLGDINYGIKTTELINSGYQEKSEKISDNTKDSNKEEEVQIDKNYFVQQYTCESGLIAKIIIPESATDDDLLGFRDMLNISLKRKFKLKE